MIGKWLAWLEIRFLPDWPVTIRSPNGEIERRIPMPFRSALGSWLCYVTALPSVLYAISDPGGTIHDPSIEEPWWECLFCGRPLGKR